MESVTECNILKKKYIFSKERNGGTLLMFSLTNSFIVSQYQYLVLNSDACIYILLLAWYYSVYRSPMLSQLHSYVW